MSSTRQRILNDIKTAMKAGDKTRLATLRLISAAIKQTEVDERRELDEPDTIVILDKLLKQRRESMAQYQQAGRDDLFAVEEAEAVLIQEYLPAPLSESEIEALIVEAINASGASGIRDMGKVVAAVKPQVQGRADMASVSKSIKEKLNS